MCILYIKVIPLSHISPSFYNIQLISMKKGLASRTALKFQRYQIQKTQQNLSSSFTVFRTHTLSKSDAEIMLPQSYSNITGKSEDLIFLVTCGKISFYAELSQNSFVDKNLTQVSILQNLVSIAGVAVDNTGHFKGQMKCLDKQKIPSTYQLEYAQILVKNMFLSRRDQYKVLKNLEDRRIHVYNRKTLYFDQLKLEFTNLMHNNTQIRKTGIITKNTKIIFRTGCSKYTILIEISKQMFELNEDKQLYLQKAVHFLLVFFQRNNFFNNKHRIQIILFARLFYPQFRTLREAYEGLQTDSKNIKGNIFTINYAVAFQKDGEGRIYQDVYRRLLWPSGSIAGFKEKFWERVSEFIFTINWQNSKSYAKNISESIEQNIEREKFIIKNKTSFKVKPFLLRLPCQLSNSEQSCFFQAISIIAEQYKHHYYFRSVSETGNAITIISAGKSYYKVDETTYKMAKSNIYLTNISCVHINLRRKQPHMRVEIAKYSSKPRYQKQNIKKLQNLLDWCIEQDAYRSPTIVNIEFAEDFQLKSRIFAENLKHCSESDIKLSQIYHYCTKPEHFINDEQKQILPQKKTAIKQIEWISSYYMNERSYLVHNYFYDNSNIETDFIKKKPLVIHDKTDFTTFQRDLKVIINKKSNYQFSELCRNSLVGRKVNRYVTATAAEESSKGSNEHEVNNFIDQNLYEQRYTNKMFEITCLEDEEERIGKLRDRKLAMSNSNNPDSQLSSGMYMSSQIRKNDRKSSDTFEIQLDSSLQQHKKSKKLPGTVNVNIFQETYKKKQYTPKANLYKKNAKRVTHNKERLKKNYRQSNLHYMMTYFNQASFQYLSSYFKKPEPHNQQQHIMYDCFEMEKEWKNIVFPILTPIYTNHRADLKSEQMNSKYSETGECVIEEQVCKHLMENFQIEKENVNSQITMSKGHVHLLLSITAKDNITLFQAVNLQKQKGIVPKILYRYLCYEQKDYRFCAKSLMFSDQNYYIKQEKNEAKKSVKLVMIQEQIKDNGQAIKQFIKLLKQKYKNIKLQLKYEKNLKSIPLETYSVRIDLVEGLKNKIYKSEKIDVIFDAFYNPDCLYQIIVEWHYCSATYVNEFIENVISSARKNKIMTHQVSKTNAFNTRWMTATIGQIIFQSRLAMDMLEERIIKERHWIWDREGYYMDRNGEAFIRFNKEKYLIEWFDNTIDKTKWRRLEMQNQLYEKFFMKSAAYDFLGGMIDSFTNSNSRKSSLALST